MTSPTDREPVESSPFHVVTGSIEVVGGAIAWTAATDEHGITYRGGDDLLPAFMQLAAADTVEMVDFLETFGIPEICQHGNPDSHPDSGRRGRQRIDVLPHCSPISFEDGRPALPVDDLRRMARAFTAATRAAMNLTARRLPESLDWQDMLRVISGFQFWPEPLVEGDSDTDETNWRQGRANFALWLTDLLHQCGVSTVATWQDQRLRVVPKADGLLGTLALLLSREVGQHDAAYTCDVCGEDVVRIRPPRKNEGVYCDKSACRRAQQRKNQARLRERKRAEGSGE
jgi:hypothetical protein